MTAYLIYSKIKLHKGGMVMSYAKQVPPECQEDDLFWTGKDGSLHMNDEWFEENVVITGNREFKEFHTREYERLLKIDWYEFENFKSYGFGSVTDYLNFYFPREKKYSPREVHEWKRIIQEEDWLCGLCMLTGKRWREVTLRGVMQREWQTAYVSEDISDAQVRYIEMCYFNTGMEFMIYEDDDDSGYSAYVSDVSELDVDKVYLFDGYTKTAKYIEL